MVIGTVPSFPSVGINGAVVTDDTRRIDRLVAQEAPLIVVFHINVFSVTSRISCEPLRRGIGCPP